MTTSTATNSGISPTVLILGANGRFGTAAVRAFAAAGWKVITQGRRPFDNLPAGSRHIGMGLGDPAALAIAAQGATVVVYAVNPPYPLWATEALPLARLGMEIAERLDAVFMLPGNVYNFGEHMPDRLREDTPQMPTTRKGHIRMLMEREMEDRARQGLRSVVIRAGDFFGCGTGSWIDLVIVKNVAQGKLVYPGPLDRKHAWAYLPDLARRFVAVAAESDLPPFSRWHFAGYTLTGAELLASIERAALMIGITPRGGFRHGGLPWFLLRIGGLVVPVWRELAEMAYLWQRPHGLIDSRSAAMVTPLPVTPLDVAMRDALLSLGHGRRRELPAAPVPISID